MIELIVLMMIFQLKHFIADYLLQFPYMYQGKGKAYKWIRPLADHSAVHASITFLIGLMYGVKLALIAALIDFITHFVIDRWKAVKTYTPQQSEFWIALGADQMLHHLVGIMIASMFIIGG